MNRFANIVETLPVPCRIFGTALRPFCLGHHAAFLRLGLPFADNPGAESSPIQLMEAVFICAQSYEDFIEGQLAGEYVAAFEKWRKAALKKNPNFKEAQDLFKSHLTDSYRIAPVWRYPSKQGISLSAPWEQLLRVRLVSAGFSVYEVMNGYLPACWYDYFTAMELRAAETCQDHKNWRRMFYTQSDAIDDLRSKEAA